MGRFIGQVAIKMAKKQSNWDMVEAELRSMGFGKEQTLEVYTAISRVAARKGLIKVCL